MTKKSILLIPLFIVFAAITINYVMLSSTGIVDSRLFLAYFNPGYMILLYLCIALFYAFIRERTAALIYGALAIVSFNLMVVVVSQVMGQNYQQITIDIVINCLLFPYNMGIYFILIIVYYTKGKIYKRAVIYSSLLTFELFGLIMWFYHIHIDPHYWIVTLVCLIIPIIIMFMTRSRDNLKDLESGRDRLLKNSES